MRIVFDPQIFCLQTFGGISRYFVELCRAIDSVRPESAEIFAPVHKNYYLEEYLHQRRGDISVDASVTRVSPDVNKYLLLLVSAFRFSIMSKSNSAQVVHHTYYWPMRPMRFAAARVTTIHDMIDERFGVNKMRSRLKRQAVAAADHVICVSENTKNDLMEYFGTPSQKISVVYLGRPEPKALADSRTLGRPYLLYVGARGGYKNFNRLLEALARSERIKRDFKLVCFGGGDFTTEEKSSIRQLRLDDRLVEHRTGNDKDLYNLYKDARLLVYPSVYEGFGLPLLEAMSNGVPVACSRSSSIPEVAGDAAEYFDPVVPESMVGALESVLYSESRRQELIARGNARAEFFSWEKCASSTLAVYDRLV